MNESLGHILSIIAIVLGVSVVIALVGLLLLVGKIRRLRVPRDADFFTTMRSVPLALVVLLDLLDFGLDIFSTPIIWIVLDRMGLPNLRNKAAIEALIPFTSPIPTFTILWIAARVLNLGELPLRRQPRDLQGRRMGSTPASRRPTITDMEDR